MEELIIDKLIFLKSRKRYFKSTIR